MGTETDTAAIIIFARYPTPGKVKTRLAASVGNELATKFYKSCAEHVITVASSVPNINATCYVFYSVAEDHSAMSTWLSSLNLSSKVHLHPQHQDPNLGVRLHHALDYVTTQLGHKKALVVGSDVPSIKQSHLTTAITSLSVFDTIVGPAEDGGYYLLGIKKGKLQRVMFEGIEWSTDMVYQQQLERITRVCGLTSAPKVLLPYLTDVDEDQDLLHWHKNENRNREELGESGKRLLDVGREVIEAAFY